MSRQLVAGLFVLSSLVTLLGCSSSGSGVALGSGEAALDSLSLGQFVFLDASDQSERRELSRAAYQRAAAADDLATRLAELRMAVGLAPDNGQAWYRLAEQYVWYGGDEQVQMALTGCRAAGGYQGRETLLEAWWRYDQGEWALGMAAAESARERFLDPEAVALVASLLQAGAGAGFTDGGTRWACWVDHWRTGGRFQVLMPNQHPDLLFFGAVEEEHYLSLIPVAAGNDPDVCRIPPDDFDNPYLRPHRARYLLDMGLIHEGRGQSGEADLAFVTALKEMPRVDGDDVGRVRRTGGAAPVWLTRDRYYVTGSLRAWQDLALDNLAGATGPADRGHWRRQALAASRRSFNRGLTTSAALRADWRDPLTLDAPRWTDDELDLVQWLVTADGEEDPAILASLGRLELLAGRHARAVSSLDRAWREGYQSPLLLTHLGVALSAIGQEGEARRRFDRALAMDPDLAAAWYNRGILDLHQGDLDAALADLQQAATLAPDDPTVGDALQEARRQAEAAASDTGS